MRSELESRKERLVSELRVGGYLKSEPVVKAFREIPREEFVLPEYREHAYADQPLSIGYGQTISAPHMVAVMTELLEPKNSDIVLEVGSGSGYQAAVLSKLVKRIYAVELEKGLVEFAKGNLERAGIKNVELIVGDGSKGLSKHAPFDKIIVTCGVPEIPVPLIKQLREGGILVAPVGGYYMQTLTVGIKKKGRLEEEKYFGCIFVPLRH